MVDGGLVSLAAHAFCNTTDTKLSASFRPPVRAQTFLPLDLRPKKTRAIRKALTPAQKALKTEREKKRHAAFPLRNYALKA